MSEHYNQKYTREEIVKILAVIKECIADGLYSISTNRNREENRQFIDEYRLTTSKQKEILLGIKIEDFCHSLKNINKGFEHEILYVFCPQRELNNILGEREKVDIYIKFNIINYSEKKRVITISFHKRNKIIEYLFR
ncbi:MAG: hypothetical protein ACRDAU_19280 [Clostridium sp.]